MCSSWVEWSLPPIIDNFPEPTSKEYEKICRFFAFVGWELFENQVCKGQCLGYIQSRAQTLPFNSMRELFWIAVSLLSAIQENQYRWLVINTYFKVDDNEKCEILCWLKNEGRGSWDNKHWELSWDGIQIPSLTSVFSYPREQLLFPGIKFAGLTVLEDRSGGEHIQVASKHRFYGYIEREILREEWRCLNGSIPDAQTVSAGRTRL